MSTPELTRRRSSRIFGRGYLSWFSILIGLIIGLAAFFTWQRVLSSCPCGFKFDPLTGGCTVVTAPVPCGDPGASGGGTSGDSGNIGGQQKVPPDIPKQKDWLVCLYVVEECRKEPFTTSFGITPKKLPGQLSPFPEMDAVKATVNSNTGVFYQSGIGPNVKIDIDAGCLKVSGSVLAADPNTTPILIPLEAKWLRAMAQGGHPNLIVTGDDNCVPTKVTALIYPDISVDGNHTPEECGCRISE